MHSIHVTRTVVLLGWGVGTSRVGDVSLGHLGFMVYGDPCHLHM